MQVAFVVFSVRALHGYIPMVVRSVGRSQMYHRQEAGAGGVRAARVKARQGKAWREGGGGGRGREGGGRGTVKHQRDASYEPTHCYGDRRAVCTTQEEFFLLKFNFF